jgi:iron complex transport system ATP-binding protein
LLLDEPTASLDLARQQSTLRVAREFARAGTAVLVVLHDLNLAAQYADRVVMLDNGRIAHSGSPAQVLTSGNILNVFNICTQILCHPEHNCPLIVPT